MDPLNGCTSLSPLPGDVNAQSGRRWPRPRELRFCPTLRIPSWLMPLRYRSGQRWQPSGKPYVVAATEVCSRFIGTCRELSPLSPFPSPFLSLLPGVCLNATLRITPLFLWCVPGRLFVAGNTCLFLFSLLSLSLPLSFFLSFSLSFLPPWVSLDAFVIAGNLLLSSFGVSLDAGVVLGTPSFLFFPFSRLSLPLPLVGTLAWDATRGSWPSY